MTTRVTSYPRRRIGTIDGIEIHRGTKASEIGFEGGNLIKWADFDKYEEPNELQFISRTKDGRLGGILLGTVDEITYEPKVQKEASIVQVEALEEEVGHGTRLVRAFEELAKEKGTKRIYLSAAWRAYGFWVKMGYRLVPPLYKGSDSSLQDVIDVVELYTDDKEERKQLIKEIRKTKLVPDKMLHRPGFLPDPIVLEKKL